MGPTSWAATQILKTRGHPRRACSPRPRARRPGPRARPRRSGPAPPTTSVLPPTLVRAGSRAGTSSDSCARGELGRGPARAGDSRPMSTTSSSPRQLAARATGSARAAGGRTSPLRSARTAARRGAGRRRSRRRSAGPRPAPAHRARVQHVRLPAGRRHEPDAARRSAPVPSSASIRNPIEVALGHALGERRLVGGERRTRRRPPPQRSSMARASARSRSRGAHTTTRTLAPRSERARAATEAVAAVVPAARQHEHAQRRAASPCALERAAPRRGRRAPSASRRGVPAAIVAAVERRASPAARQQVHQCRQGRGSARRRFRSRISRVLLFRVALDALQPGRIGGQERQARTAPARPPARRRGAPARGAGTAPRARRCRTSCRRGTTRGTRRRV